MSLELVDGSKNYELSHPSGAKFILRHWTIGMQDETDKRCLYQQDGKFLYNTALDRELKLDLAVQSWSGVTSEGQEVPCDSENKKKLPVGIALWLIKEIEERAGLRMQLEEKKS